MSSDVVASTARLRALAHPTRVRIVDLLRQHPSLTATECATMLHLTPKTCSYHLATLAANGLVSEIPVSGRNRPWQLTSSAKTSNAHTGTEFRTSAAIPDGSVPPTDGAGEPNRLSDNDTDSWRPGDPWRSADDDSEPLRGDDHVTSRPAAEPLHGGEHVTHRPAARRGTRADEVRVRREESLLADAADAITTASANPAWAATAVVHSHPCTMTPDELAAWCDDVERLTRRHVRRSAGELPDPARLPVDLTFFGAPS